VQDPDEATFRSMPDSAIRGLNVQYIMRLREISPLLIRLSTEAHPQEKQEAPELLIEPAGQACTECGGAMTRAHMGRLLEFRCHTGHRLGLKSLIAQKSTIVEHSLGTALSQSEELVSLLRSAAAQAPPEGVKAAELEIQRRLEEQETLRQLLDTARDASQAV
jgi:two-component system, chemotaxis family, protein-glutamate methylesterase/glutaminase